MAGELKVAAITNYLVSAGWKRSGGTQNATFWEHQGDYEVLVPARDGMGDGIRRIRETLRCLSVAEGRPEQEIAQVIRAMTVRVAECSHPAAYVLAGIGDAGADDPAERGIAWESVTDDPIEVDGFRDLRATAALGRCGDCGVLVASVRMWELEQWTIENGPSWSTGWTPLLRPGERAQR